MVKNVRSAWFGIVGALQRAKSPTSTGNTGKYATHSLVALPDGQLMYARNASLVAAKDVFAAQRAAERRMREARLAHLLTEATQSESGAAESTR